MNPFQIFNLNWFDILLAIVFIILLITFLKEFKITSSRSWVVLLGLTALGGLFMFQRWRRHQLLKQFEEREDALRKLELEYEDLRKQGKITEEAYKKAKERLKHAKVEEGLAIMRADERLKDRLDEIEKKYSDLSPEESAALIKEALR